MPDSPAFLRFSLQTDTNEPPNELQMKLCSDTSLITDQIPVEEVELSSHGKWLLKISEVLIMMGLI